MGQYDFSLDTDIFLPSDTAPEATISGGLAGSKAGGLSQKNKIN